MLFDNFSDAWSTMLWSIFGIALVMGLLVNKTNFCTMGAVSDWVNMGDKGRMRAWLFAIALAILGITLFEKFGILSVDHTFPPYRHGTFRISEYLLGGFMFGIGMTLASGCGNKTLIRIGGGNIKSIMVAIIIGIIAYFMVNPFPGSDKTLMSVLFEPWMKHLRFSVGEHQDIGALLGSKDNLASMRFYSGLAIAGLLLIYIFKSSEFRRNFDNVLGGLAVGLAVIAAWYVTGTIKVEADNFGEKTQVSLRKFVADWDTFVEEDDEENAPKLIKPVESFSLGTQSFTFINPMGQTVRAVANKMEKPYWTFGVMAFFGVILGSFLWAVLSRSFRIEWFASFKDFGSHFIGAILMGFGGVLGLGCTIGQGVTGFSTLALGSILTFISIVFGSALTMKIQLYRMMYEDASFGAVLVTSLVDLKLLPKGMRKLEGV